MRKNILLFMAAALFLCSCGDRSDSRNHPLLVRAASLKGKGQFEDSSKCLQEYLLINPKSAKAHLELANLYSEDLDDPFLAIYHYRQHLLWAKDSQDKDSINRLVFAAEKKYLDILREKVAHPPVFSDEKKNSKPAAKTSAKPPKVVATPTKQPEKKKEQTATQPKAEPKKEESKTTHAKPPEPKKEEPKTATQPKTEPKKEESKPVTQTKAEPKKEEQKSATQPKTEAKKEEPKTAQTKPSDQKKEKFYYTVQKGDSLETIAKKLFGSIKYAEYIHELNKREISTPMDLQIGQKLLIVTPPPQSKEKN